MALLIGLWRVCGEGEKEKGAFRLRGDDSRTFDFFLFP